MNAQAVDKNGAADYLQLSLTTINHRIANGAFPEPDVVSSANSPDVQWWLIETLDRYKRSLAAQKAAKTRKRNRSKK
jgi:hypothetical protein